MTTIKINCTGAATMPLDKIVGLQGNLKELSVENYGKLLALMVKEGFAFPVNIARIEGKPHGVIDGHQRHKVVMQAIADGAELVDAAGRKTHVLPVNWIECRDQKHAARLILSAVSQFGKVTDDGWSYGPVKDPEKKQHPCFVPYDELPAEQKAKDFLFCGVADALKHLL